MNLQYSSRFRITIQFSSHLIYLIRFTMHRPSPSGSPPHSSHPTAPLHPQTPTTPSIAAPSGTPASPHHSASPSAATPGSDPASPMAHAGHASHVHPHLGHHPASLMHFLPFQGSPVVAGTHVQVLVTVWYVWYCGSVSLTRYSETPL